MTVLTTRARPVLLPAGISLLAGALATIAGYASLWARQGDEAVLVRALGAVLAAGAALLWAGGVEVPQLLPWPVGWLASHDVARRTVRSSGLTRYLAVSMLAGYAWAGIAAAVWLTSGSVGDGARYDAVVHAVFLGFTISMVMAHAPVVFPVVTGRRIAYHPVLYGPVALRHARQVGAVLNIVALVGFVGAVGARQ